MCTTSPPHNPQALRFDTLSTKAAFDPDQDPLPHAAAAPNDSTLQQQRQRHHQRQPEPAMGERDGGSTTPVGSSAAPALADGPAVVGAARAVAAPAPAPARWRLLLLSMAALVVVAMVGLVDTRAAGVMLPLSQPGHGRGLRRRELGAERRGVVEEADKRGGVGGGGGGGGPPAAPQQQQAQAQAQQPPPQQQASGPDGRDYLPPIIIPNATDASGAATADAAGTDPRGLPTILGRDAGRPAKVVLPRRMPPAGQKLPLVLVLHGWGSNGTHHDAYLGVSARVDDAALGGGFVVLLPDGMRNSKGYRFWNAPACCNRENMAVDDLGYLTELLAVRFFGWGGVGGWRVGGGEGGCSSIRDGEQKELYLTDPRHNRNMRGRTTQEAVQRLPVDPGRIYVVGHSNGGQMALYLACRTDVVRGALHCVGECV